MRKPMPLKSSAPFVVALTVNAALIWPAWDGAVMALVTWAVALVLAVMWYRAVGFGLTNYGWVVYSLLAAAVVSAILSLFGGAGMVLGFTIQGAILLAGVAVICTRNKELAEKAAPTQAPRHAKD